MTNKFSIQRSLWRTTLLLSTSMLLCSISAEAQKRNHKAATKTAKKTTQKTTKPTTTKQVIKPTKQKSDNLNLDSKDKSVTVTSEFTPTLKESSKINFNGESAPLPADKISQLSYSTPSQNLFFPYVPGSLRPLSYTIKDTTQWHNEGFIKAGYGNYHAPYLEGDVSLGDGTHSAISIYAKHTQGKGHLPLQKYGKTEASINGVFQVNDDLELNGKAYFDQNSLHAYGIRRADSAYLNNDSTQLRYATYGVKFGLKNKRPNALGIDYAPSLNMNIFSTNQQATESNLDINVPISKSITDNINVDLGFRADITSLKNKATDTTLKSNIYYISPALSYKTDNLKVHVGWTPSWNNGNFRALPDLNFEAKIPNVHFLVFGGYKGYYNKNTFRSLFNYNNWINVPSSLLNTRVNELFGGIKGSVGEHLTYQGQVSYMKLHNQALYVNHYYLGNRFDVIYEPKMTDLRLHGELEYTKGEDFSLLAGLTIDNYSNLDSNKQAWGLLPFQLNGALRWRVFDKLWFKSDINLFNGNYYVDINGAAQKTKAVADWNAGLEYKFHKNFSVWMDVNNILNKNYQRWNQYQNFGTQFQAGLIWNFSLSK